MRRRIIHVDMDEFFAAVEKLDNPELRGRPLLIGGSPEGRGVVSTASYEARPYGCRSAMPMARAIRLCPDAIVLPVRGERYAEVSRQVFAIFDRFTPLVEPASIDEAFLDVTGCEELFGPAPEIAASIKRAIAQEVGITASIGVAPSKFLAKLASDLHKPDGLVVIAEERVAEILDPLPVGKLWGVGPAAIRRLAAFGIHTIGELRSAPRESIVRVFGKAADHYLDLANGRDDRPVVVERDPKSMGQERTFPRDVEDADELRAAMLGQVEEVARRLRAHGLEARTVTLKLRSGDFTTRTRSKTLPEPTNVTDELWGAASALLAAWAGAGVRPLRLLGFSVSNLSAAEGGGASLVPDAERGRGRRLDRAVDRIAERFGSGAVRRASAKRRREEEP